MMKKIFLLMSSLTLQLVSENIKPEAPLTEEKLENIMQKIKQQPDLLSKLLAVKFFYDYPRVDSKSIISTPTQFSYQVSSSTINKERQFFKDILSCVNNNDQNCPTAVTTLKNDWEAHEGKGFLEELSNNFLMILKNRKIINSHEQFLSDRRTVFKANQHWALQSLVTKLITFIQTFK
jgi:hypothetical protein